MKETSTIEFRDSSIDKVKFDNIDFSHVKDGITKCRNRLYIHFKVAKKSSLKGLKLGIHKKSRSKYFNL